MKLLRIGELLVPVQRIWVEIQFAIHAHESSKSGSTPNNICIRLHDEHVVLVPTCGLASVLEAGSGDGTGT